MALGSETQGWVDAFVNDRDSVIESALARAPSPQRARVNLDRLLSAVDDPSELLRNLTDDIHTLQTLIALLSSSQYLTEILLRNPGYVALLSQHGGLAQIKSAGWLRAEARNTTDPWLIGKDGDAAALDALRRYEQREMLRIGAADLAGLIELGSVTRQLSRLADSVIQTALEIVAGQLDISPDGFVVVAMGKLGGDELNYSSDIDLLFLCQGNGDDQTEKWHKLGERLIKALCEPTGEGFLYRVDMRLRPWGRVGPLTPTVAGYLRYLRENARLWEKQALLRGRPAAGDLGLGHAFLSQVEPLLFASGAEAVRLEVHAMKQQTESYLRQAGRTWGEVKLGEGSIRDAEFVVQYLQLAHGTRDEELRTGNTLEAMNRLAERRLLTLGEHRILTEGYTFLRTVEHYLQLLEYRQTHTLPANPADLRYLARRLGYAGPNAASEFVARYEQHASAVRAVYLRHLASVNQSDSEPSHSFAALTGEALMGGALMGEALTGEGLSAGGIATMLEHKDAPSAAARQHMARLVPSYAATFDPIEIERHAVMAARLDQEHPVIVDATPLDRGRTRVTIVGYDYLGELSLICGLMFAYGFTIVDGYVYTYEQTTETLGHRKIVDVFTVEPVGAAPGALVWHDYASDLLKLIRHLQQGQPRSAQGELAKRVAAALRLREPEAPTLPPIDIEIDNEASDRYTVLQISAPDTPGFLYEFTNALALSGVHIAQVFVISTGSRVRDTLFVTDANGDKIKADARQRELRSATVLIKHFTHLLPRSPNPESALLHFHEYLGELFGRPSWPDELASLERPEVLYALARLLGVSEFLWDDFLRMQYENLFPVVRDVESLQRARSRQELASELEAVLRGPAWQDQLNEFKDREMFRIDMRHILGQVESYTGFSAELTDLAEVVLAAACEQARRGLVALHGTPEDQEGRPARFVLAALGKCGGRELGFASDIELMFVFDGSGETTGPRTIPSPEFFEKLVVEVTRAIRARREGIFQIDLQLRPYGKAGSLAVSLDAFRRYFSPSGPAWPYERQALVKLRPISGDAGLGQDLEALRDAFLYRGEPFDVAAMRAMRERQLRHLVEAGRINAKFSKGGIVDLEYIVQGLQITHGHRHPDVRNTNTAQAIKALAQVGAVSAENAARLSEALNFLQNLINALRMVRGNNKDLTVPPPESEEFGFLARRLGYGHDPGRLGVALNEHMGWVQRLEGRLLSA